MKQQDRYPDQHDFDKIIKPITLSMKKGTWEVYKRIIPRNIKLNESILQLIHDKIVKETIKSTSEEIDKWSKDQDYWAKKRKKK